MTQLCFVMYFVCDFQGQDFKAQPRIEGCLVLLGNLKISCQMMYICLLCQAVTYITWGGLSLSVKWLGWGSAAPHGSGHKKVIHPQWIWSELLPHVQTLNAALLDFSGHFGTSWKVNICIVDLESCYGKCVSRRFLIYTSSRHWATSPFVLSHVSLQLHSGVWKMWLFSC